MTDRDAILALVERLGWHHEHPITGKLVLKNPDGPEAARALTELQAERDAGDRIIAGIVRALPASFTNGETKLAEAIEKMVARALTAEARVSELEAERTRAQTETARLLLAAKILYANAYNGLAAEEGREIPDYDLPGWLADCKADIVAFPGIAQEQEQT